MNIKSAVLTAVGGRKENQDYTVCREKAAYGCYLVADGLGGHSGGKIASHTVGIAIADSFLELPGASRRHLEGYISSAVDRFRKSVAEKNIAIAPRTTLVLLLVGDGMAVWTHIGDSRLYHFRRGEVVFQTDDHSVPNQLAKSGRISFEDIRSHEDRNRLTRAFDGQEGMNVEYCSDPLALTKGDVFLLCSDGFWEYVFENEMECDLKDAGNADRWLKLLELRLLERVPLKNDNYSAVAVFID